MKFDIIPRRKLWFSISGGLVLLSIILVMVFGLNAGIDFTGGTRIETIVIGDSVSAQEVTEQFEAAVGTDKGESITATFDGNGFVIRSRLLTEADTTKLADTFAEKNNISIEQINTIGPTVGGVFKKRAFTAIFLSILTIIAYVAFAFRKMPKGLSSWKFGLAAIVALAHDITIIIGIFALLGVFYGVEIDTLFITALLTVLAFSVNDTIVVFDRIRENLKGEKSNKNLAIVAEAAVWQSMRRSINTSLSTLLVVLAMLFFFLGFSSLFTFFVALAAGLIVGTYSSIFLATPLVVVWHNQSK